MIHSLPPDWSWVPLGDLIQETRPITYGVVQPGEHDPNGIILIRGGDYSNGWRPVEQLMRVSPKVEAAFARARLRPGDLVITIKGDVGAAAEVPAELDGANLSQTNARLAINQKKSEPRLVLNFLMSSLGKKEVHKSTQVGAQPGLVFPDIIKFMIPLPPLAEQRRIVAVLDAWDRAITNATGIIRMKERRFSAIRQQLIEKRQAAQLADNEWRPVEFAELTSELATRNAGRLGTDKVMGVIKGEGLVPMRAHVMANDLNRYKVVPPGAFAYNPMRLNIGSIAASEHTDEVVVSPDYVVFQARPSAADPDFLRFFIGTKKWRDHLSMAGTGSVRTRIYYDALAEMVLRVPSLKQQQRIGTTLARLESDIKASKALLDKLRTQKRALMQKLLTGERRLDVDFDLASPLRGSVGAEQAA